MYRHFLKGGLPKNHCLYLLAVSGHAAEPPHAAAAAAAAAAYASPTDADAAVHVSPTAAALCSSG